MPSARRRRGGGALAAAPAPAPAPLPVAWGDGTTEPATLEPSASDDRAFTVVAEHTYVTRIPTVGEGFFRRPRVRIAWGDGTTSRGRVVIRAGRTMVVGRHRRPGRLRARRVVVTVRETVSGAVLRIVRPVRVAR